MSQCDRILEALEAAGSRGVCGTTFLAMNIPRYSARVNDLRGRGIEIATTRCDDANHSHETRQYSFALAPALTLFR